MFGSAFPKFIIETDSQLGDCLIISKCTYHRQLVTDTSKVKGGGWYSIDLFEKKLTLYGDSYEFGRAKLEDISNCVKNHKVFFNRALSRRVEDEYRIFYKEIDGSMIEILY